MPYSPETRKQKSREYYERTREKALARQKAYSESHKKERKEYVAANRELVYKVNREWRERNREQWLKISRKKNLAYRTGLKDEFIAAYGSRCACCGEDYREFLTVDHIGGGGATERRTLGWRGLGAAFYLHLKKLGWPKDRYRLLCMNCNFATRNGKPCPHTTESTLHVVEGLVC
jgi:hypothetical protein